MSDTLREGESEQFMKSMNDLYREHHRHRQEIRENSSAFFAEIRTLLNNEQQIGILLYGYSELVLKALCGFRDYLITAKFPTLKTKEFFNHPLEAKVSEQFKIFVCEGQPKTQTATRDRLTYHDGSVYAQALRKRNFQDIILIPDIVVGNIIENFDINMIIVGANGFSDIFFRHSAGHSSIINLGREFRGRNDTLFPLIILVVSSEKYLRTYDRESQAIRPTPREWYDINGCLLFEETEKVATRKHIWFTQDTNMLRRLCEGRIRLLNPREDTIPIKHLDYIICNSGWFPIRAGSNSEPADSNDRVKSFLDAQESTLVAH